MELSTATNLIKPGVDSSSPQTWADLGSGPGLFAKALSSLLADQSTIYAVDKQSWMGKIDSLNKNIKIVQHEQDFNEYIMHSTRIDGILMANAIHFVEDKIKFLNVAFDHCLKADGRLILVEYNIDAPNPWVPYPVSFQSLAALGKKHSFAISKLGGAPSIFHPDGLYSALLSKD